MRFGMVLAVSSSPGISPVCTLSPSISVLHVLPGLPGPSSSALSCLPTHRAWRWLSMFALPHGNTLLFWGWSTYLAHHWEGTLDQPVPVYPTLRHLAGTTTPTLLPQTLSVLCSGVCTPPFILRLCLYPAARFYHKHGCPSPLDSVTEERDCESTSLSHSFPSHSEEELRAVASLSVAFQGHGWIGTS